jgi:hypothetical protein
MKPELWGLDPSSNLAAAELLVSDLDREDRLVAADRWFLALDFLRLAGMLDVAPTDISLGRAYRAVGEVLRGDGHEDRERDTEVKAQIDRLRRNR